MCACLWRADACAQGVPVARTAGVRYASFSGRGQNRERARGQRDITVCLTSSSSEKGSSKELIKPVIIRKRKFERAHQARHQVSPPPRAAADPRMGDHESDGLENQDDEEEEDEDDEPEHDLTGGGALLSVQPPAATAAPRLHNAPRECAIRMPRGKAANTGARRPITPATGPGQASTRFCNLAEALLATRGATFGNKVAKSVCSLKITKQVGGLSHTLGVARKRTVVQ